MPRPNSSTADADAAGAGTDDSGGASGDADLGMDTASRRGVIEAVKDGVSSTARRSLTARRVTAALKGTAVTAAEDLAAEHPSAQLLRIRPYDDDAGIDAAGELWKALHRYKSSWFGVVNESPRYSWEAWFEDDVITFYLFASSDAAATKARKAISGTYPNAEIETVWRAADVHHDTDDNGGGVGGVAVTEDDDLPAPALTRSNIYGGGVVAPSDADDDTGAPTDAAAPASATAPDADDEHVVAAEFTLRYSEYLPIRSQRGPDPYSDDELPYQNVLSSLLSGEDTRVALQVTARPVSDAWGKQGPIEHLNPLRDSADDIQARMQEESTREGVSLDADDDERSAAQGEKSYANTIEDRTKWPGYRVNIRVIAVGPQKQHLRDTVDDTADSIERMYQQRSQKFTRTAMTGSDAVTAVKRFVARSVVKDYGTLGHDTVLLSAHEVGALAHPPDARIENDDVNWSMTRAGAKPPGEMEAFGDAAREHDAVPKRAVPSGDPTTGAFRVAIPGREVGDGEEGARAEHRADADSDDAGDAPDAETGRIRSAVQRAATAVLGDSESDDDDGDGEGGADSSAEVTTGDMPPDTTDTTTTTESNNTPSDTEPATASDGEDAGGAHPAWIDSSDDLHHVTHPSLRAALGIYAILAAVAASSAAVGAAKLLRATRALPLPDAAIEVLAGAPSTVAWVFLGIAGVAVAAVAWNEVTRRATAYAFTDEKVVRKDGVVRRSVDPLRYENIADVEWSQSVAERVLGYGTVSLYSAGGTDTTDMTLTQCPDPRGAASLIDEQLEHHRQQRAAGGAGGEAGGTPGDDA